jgi:uncharacterized protein (DUF433 family)
MTLGAAISLSATIQYTNLPPDAEQAQVSNFINMSSAKYAGFVPADQIHTIFEGRYFLNDGGVPYSIRVSTVSNPMVPGTRIPVYKISALLDGGMDVAAVMRDFPSLNTVQIEDARKYAKANPNLGRQYAKRSLKSALQDMDFHEYLGT